MNFPLMVALTVVFGILAVGTLLYILLAPNDRRRVEQRLGSAGPGAGGQQGQFVQRLADSGRGLDAVFKDQDEIDALLLRAGFRGQNARSGFYILQLLLPLAAVLLFVFLWSANLHARSLTESLMYLFVLVAVGFLAPRFLLRAKASARQNAIRREVSLLINLLILLYEAGLSTRQAINTLVKDAKGVLPELVEEFRSVARQIDAGGDTADALYGMSAGLDVPELSTVIGVLRQAEKYGGEVRDPLAEALDVIEERRGLTLRERVNAMSGKMTIVMVLFFFPGLMFFIAGPPFTAIFVNIFNR